MEAEVLFEYAAHKSKQQISLVKNIFAVDDVY